MDIAWRDIILPDTPILEIVIRGTIVYVVLFVLLRAVNKRQGGGLSFNDMLVIVLVADAAQNAMAGVYTSVPDGLLLVAVIVFWAWALDWLSYHSTVVQRLTRPEPVPLVRDGEVLRHNLRKELITTAELMAELRLQGVEHPSEVRLAAIEGDGRISVIKSEGESNGNRKANAAT
jgi:uncharacterized membrane protein YcaP (DUF421 family)